ncbi:hypothetical protein LX32DRAFT_660299 [Colletotrichum zoysiae]|uniref:Uncharacterized protein n=1 Tax=Colletotrichum zoysiae TaxID=1216348 RepID=A0AAD9HSZ0_9PEZI|nr:hypothetical protein LX32DRAFT_660299 [Colletotrichum zoysiae]
MAGESSPDPLQEPGSNRPLKCNTPSENSISGVGSQQGLLSQLQDSQSTTTCVFQDEKNSQHGLVQSGKSEEDQIHEANQSFSFAPQPKHRPYQFSGRQKHPNIDFETFDAPKGEAERLFVDTTPPESGTPRRYWERTSPENSRDHHRKTAGSQTGNSSSHIRREMEGRSITDDLGLDSVQPELEHAIIRTGMPTQHISGGISPLVETRPAVENDSESRSSTVNHPPGLTVEGRCSGRPFADADASFPGFHLITAQKSGQIPVIKKDTISCLNSPREAVDSITKPVHASHQRMDTMISVKAPQALNDNTFERDKREQQIHTPQYDKQHLKANVTSSPLPASNDGTVLPNSSRFDLSDTRKNGNMFLDVHFHGSQMFQDIESRVIVRNDTDHVQRSHFNVLQSMITHHNRFLEDAKLTEESLKTEIADQELAIEALKTHMQRSDLRHQQEKQHQKTLNAEVTSLLQKKDEVIAIMAQREDRERELGAEVAKLRALEEEHAAETSELKSKLEETQAKLDKLKDKGRGYKDHLNKAIAEHQELWQQSRDISQRTIDDMRKEHQESEEHFRSALEEKEAAQDKLNRIFDDKRAVLEKELHTAASKTKSLESAMGILEGDLLAEAEKRKGLEEQLSKSIARETFLQRVEGSITEISDRLNEMHVKSVQTDVVPISIVERLDKITAHVQSAPWADLGDEIRQSLDYFQKEVIPRFLQEVKSTTTERPIIEDRLKSLEKTVQNQVVLQLLQQISEEKKENQALFLSLKAKDGLMTELSNAVSEMACRLQELKASVALPCQNGTTLEAEIRVLHERVLSRDHQVSEIQAELKFQREAHEVTLRELRERLHQAEEDVRQKSELLKDSQCKTITEEDECAANAQEEKRELELQLRHSEDSRQNIQQQLSESEAEIKRLKTLEGNSEIPNLRKELEDANQRIVNLTLKLRETQTPAVGAGVLDQLAEQLAQLNNMKEDIRQLKTSGKAYTTVSKELTTMLFKQDALDDILAPNSMVVPEPDLPDLQQGDPVNPLPIFEVTSSETTPVQGGKKTVFRRPVEEPYQEVPVPSVAQEKLHRREAKSHGPHPKPILRPQRMKIGPLKSLRDSLVTRHAGHSSYNRPVQGASMTGQIAISDVRSNLVGNRKVQISHLTSHGDWQNMTAHGNQSVQQGTKRGSGLLPSAQRPKRSKTSFPVDDDDNNDGSSVAGEQNIVDSQKIESSQQTDINSNQSSQGGSQDNDHTSRHFHQSTHMPSVE